MFLSFHLKLKHNWFSQLFKNHFERNGFFYFPKSRDSLKGRLSGSFGKKLLAFCWVLGCCFYLTFDVRLTSKAMIDLLLICFVIEFIYVLILAFQYSGLNVIIWLNIINQFFEELSNLPRISRLNDICFPIIFWVVQ
jgi:hypothetical protein